mmetsp:Transcript_26338/g.30320  ORF Transcript_26338/g.30320 Transcript_26338/m.30320 type:complete len:114 (-) Transcript_26338:674-1015(-)
MGGVAQSGGIHVGGIHGAHELPLVFAANVERRLDRFRGGELFGGPELGRAGGVVWVFVIRGNSAPVERVCGGEASVDLCVHGMGTFRDWGFVVVLVTRDVSWGFEEFVRISES